MAEPSGNANVRILFVSAEPSDAARLRLSREQREIRAELQASEHRHRFEFLTAVAARSRDLSRALLEDRPDILHVSGHGARSGILVLEDDAGAIHPAQPRAVVDLLAAAGASPRCIVLNACFSSRLAKALLEVAPFVVGMRRSILDDAAIAFSIGFYQGLGAGWDPPAAFALGKAQVAMYQLSQRSVPVLMARAAAATLMRRPTARQTRAQAEASRHPQPDPPSHPQPQPQPHPQPHPEPPPPPAGRLRLGIRSFIGHGAEMAEEADRLLALEPYFDGRRIRHARLWQAAILPELARFLGEAAATRRPLHLNLAALPSIAFATGYILEAKGGFDIAVRQRGLTGTEDWQAAVGALPAAAPLWAVEETLPAVPGCPDVALAVGVTRPVLADVRCYLGRSGIQVGRILHAGCGDATAQTAVADGAHAARLAQSLCRMIEARSAEERQGTLHLFVSAPNALVLFLGQTARAFGRIQLYDHDLEARDVPGAYIPAFALPLAPR